MTRFTFKLQNVPNKNEENQVSNNNKKSAPQPIVGQGKRPLPEWLRPLTSPKRTNENELKLPKRQKTTNEGTTVPTDAVEAREANHFRKSTEPPSTSAQSKENANESIQTGAASTEPSLENIDNNESPFELSMDYPVVSY